MMSGAKNTPIKWSSLLTDICPKPYLNAAQKLAPAGVTTVENLLWVFPLSIHRAPTLTSFAEAIDGELFKGRGTVISCQAKPNFYAKGKKGTLLYTVTIHLRDFFSTSVLSLRWFNCYPSLKKNLESMKEIQFIGPVSSFQGQLQITNPDLINLSYSNQHEEASVDADQLIIRYPTINGVPGTTIQKILELFPSAWWREIENTFPYHFSSSNEQMSLSEAFRLMHGLGEWTPEHFQQAKMRLIYHEFFHEQLKILLRRQIGQAPRAEKMAIPDQLLKRLESTFPFELTVDQHAAIQAIATDFTSGKPMMRLIQGDVGCGKTAVAVIAALMAIENGGQVAMMCPTETLALQHYLEIAEIMKKNGKNASLLLGSTSRKEKLSIQAQLISGEIDFVVGTHSLIQETVQFKKLILAIIDEQHKFGVRQRIRLAEKGEATHSLVMTATPIPRSLSLTQFGDLDITTIKTMPQGRKGQKTRIVTPQTFEQFLSFFMTRLNMGEQAYVVVPAIEESEKQELLALESVYQRLTSFFPTARIGTMHGRMKSDEKEQALFRFRDGLDQVLLATSVIEVGINNPNATIMAIMNPERFGLSSLHQLRGRVGRGDKVGFCFLVNDRQISADSLHRLMVIEQHTDGFIIAEEDLKIRGEGDLFGTGQSGANSARKLADILHHGEILQQARQDVEKLKQVNDQQLLSILKQMSEDPLILSTI